jgi:putative flippase GtrA
VRSQLPRYVVVGAANTLLSAAVFAALSGVGVPSVLAAALAFLAGAANGYAWNRGWTFRARDTRAARLRYLAVQALGLAATTGGLATLAPAVGADAGYALVLPAVTLATFAANRAWTFSSPGARAARGTPTP